MTSVEQARNALDQARKILRVCAVYIDQPVTKGVAENTAAKIDAALASLEGERGTVRVKALEWTHDGGCMWYADCYRIRRDIGEPDLYTVAGWDAGTNPYKTLVAARAAAQADYQRRILSAIEGA